MVQDVSARHLSLGLEGLKSNLLNPCLSHPDVI